MLEHSQVLQQNKEDGIKNHTKKVIHIKWKIIDNFSADSFSIRIDFSCCDYVEDRVSKQILSGKKYRKQSFLNYGILTILKKGNGKLILFNQLTWIKQDRTGDSRSCWG